MNLLLLEPEEAAEEVTLSGRRARHLLEVLKVEPGNRVRLGVLNGPKGFGDVLEAGDDAVRLRVSLEDAAPSPSSVW